MKRQNYIFITIIILFELSFYSVNAQNDNTDTTNVFTLNDLKNYAVEHSYEVKNADLDIRKAKAQKWETTAIGLPQISGSAEYQNFPDIPTQLMPNFIAPAVYDVNTNAFGLTPLTPFQSGGKIPVQFGSKHNVDWKLSATQLIFSGEYIVGLKASKIYLSLSQRTKEKSILTVKENIEKTWYLILVTEESLRVLDSVYNNINKLYKETQALYKSGFVEETDIQQLKLNLQNTENSIITFKKQKDVLYRLLKFQAGIDYDKPVNISGTLQDAVNEIEASTILNDAFNVNKNIDYQLLQVQENLSDLSLQREKTKYLPSIAAFYSYSNKAMSDSLNLLTEKSNWYPTSLWGIQISIPIFSSGKRYAKIKQAQFDLEQKRNLKQQTEQALLLHNAQIRSDYQTALNTVKNNSENRYLAEKIFKNTLTKFKVGTVSSMTLTQTQTQYFQTLSKYYQSLNNLIDENIKLKKLMNLL
ncbi:MAG: TolC family protein [Bacteroidales bacterium]|nr:TolC family protein [Bacteroidales bacterium]